MVKPTIGITVSLDPGVRLREGVGYAYLKRAYGRAVAEAGGIPLLLVPEADVPDVVAACAGFVISGGDDLPAEAQPDGSFPQPATKDAAPEVPERIAWERGLIDAARASGRPLLGVCYGMQLLNLHLGGTLHESFSSEIDHGGAGRFTEHGLLRKAPHPALEGLPARTEVASSHRQCIDHVAPGLDVLAEAPDGIVEGLGRGDVLGVEWHPEQDATGPAVYGWLVERARAALEGRARRTPSPRG